MCGEQTNQSANRRRRRQGPNVETRHRCTFRLAHSLAAKIENGGQPAAYLPIFLLDELAVKESPTRKRWSRAGHKVHITRAKTGAPTDCPHSLSFGNKPKKHTLTVHSVTSGTWPQYTHTNTLVNRGCSCWCVLRGKKPTPLMNTGNFVHCRQNCHLLLLFTTSSSTQLDIILLFLKVNYTCILWGVFYKFACTC